MQCLIWKKVEPELIPDPDTYIFLEKGTRIGVSYISNRYSKTNSKYLKSYNPKQESKHIIFLDTNNLYGYAISTFLTTIGSTWIDPKELRELHSYPLGKIEIKR